MQGSGGERGRDAARRQGGQAGRGLWQVEKVRLDVVYPSSRVLGYWLISIRAQGLHQATGGTPLGAGLLTYLEQGSGYTPVHRGYTRVHQGTGGIPGHRIIEDELACALLCSSRVPLMTKFDVDKFECSCALEFDPYHADCNVPQVCRRLTVPRVTVPRWLVLVVYRGVGFDLDCSQVSANEADSPEPSKREERLVKCSTRRSMGCLEESPVCVFLATGNPKERDRPTDAGHSRRAGLPTPGGNIVT